MVHIHAEGPAFFCWIPKLFGKRVISTIHGLDWAREKWKFGVGSKFIRQGEKNAVKYADEIIVLSKGVQKYFMETYGRETHFIPNGVNRPQIRKASLITDKFGLKKDSYILFLGRLVPEKGIRYLVEACIRLFEGIKYVLPILHPNKKRLALIMCPEEDSASVEWARQKDENWVNKDITSLEFVENIFRLMNWNRECRYKVLGRVANSDQGLCMLFDLEEAIMFTPKPQEYADPLTGEMKKKQMKFFPDTYRNRIGKSYNDYIADHQMNLFEDFIGYQGSAVLDEPVREEDSFSKESMSQESEISENILLPDLAKQSESIEQQSGEIAERGMPT